MHDMESIVQIIKIMHHIFILELWKMFQEIQSTQHVKANCFYNEICTNLYDQTDISSDERAIYPECVNPKDEIQRSIYSGFDKNIVYNLKFIKLYKKRCTTKHSSHVTVTVFIFFGADSFRNYV